MAKPLIFLFAVLALLSTPLACRAASGDTYSMTITRVLDGDTVSGRKTGVAGQPEVTIRLYGIDTPESREQGRGMQPGGAEATAFLRAMLPVGTECNVIVAKVDRHEGEMGLLLFVRESPGNIALVLVQEELLRAGMAWVYPEYCDDRALCAEFERMEQEAQAGRLGIWKAGNAVPPWEWRSGK